MDQIAETKANGFTITLFRRGAEYVLRLRAGGSRDETYLVSDIEEAFRQFSRWSIMASV